LHQAMRVVVFWLIFALNRDTVVPGEESTSPLSRLEGLFGYSLYILSQLEDSRDQS
jgi:hypothetical protein